MVATGEVEFVELLLAEEARGEGRLVAELGADPDLLVRARDGRYDIGDESDAPSLAGETARVRARALRALRRIDVLPPVDELLRLLTDPSSQVVREAVLTLWRESRT